MPCTCAIRFAGDACGYHTRMAFFSKRIRRWVILALAVPVGSWLLAQLADQIRARRGESTVTKALRAPQQWRERRAAKAARAA